MQHRPLFIATSKGFVNLSLVQHIKPPERGLVRFVFGENEYVDLPAKEAQGIEATMVNELLVFAE
jgi:hypothetical protein